MSDQVTLIPPEAPASAPLSVEELSDAWPVLSIEEKVEGFKLLPTGDADDFFLSLGAHAMSELALALPFSERQLWMRLVPPDDAADIIQEAPAEVRAGLISLLDEPTRREVTALMAYKEDAAGGLMSPRYGRLRSEMTVDEAISYLRRQAKEHPETLYYVYVLDPAQKLLGVVSFRELFAAPGDRQIREVMNTDIVSVPEDMDQESVSHLFAQHDLVAVPVVDAEGRMKGIITVDDIVDVVREEATEDIHKIGGTSALDAPYFATSFGEMLKKRAGWLVVLFFGQMLTATAIKHYEGQLSAAIVLALFIPMIISSGGNTGGQAATLVIRALSMGEVRIRDWWRVLYREFGTGLALGLILGIIGFARIMVWPGDSTLAGEPLFRLALAIGMSLVGVVLWGAVMGSMLPLLLSRMRLDPASASTPFVATLSDVAGLIIYFTMAQIALQGILL